MRYQIMGLIKRCGGFTVTTMILAVLVMAGCGGGGGGSTDGGSTTTGETNTGGTTTGGTTTGGTTTGGTTTGGTTTGGTTTGTFQPPRTGQTYKYATGDDGDLRKGVAWPSPGFTDIGDGTVADNLTGLIWAKSAFTPTVGACVGGTKTWQGALDYVDCLNSISYLGHSDWLLPNINELKSLINIDRVSNGPFTGVGLKFFWSSTTIIDWTNGAHTFGIEGGAPSPGNKAYGDKDYVWPIREKQWSSSSLSLPKTGQTTSYASGDDGALQRGVADPVPRFTVNGDGTVTDKRTGLIWLENANCFGTKTWTGALSSANTLANGRCGLGDGSVAGDWRLPNWLELRSLVDYGRANPDLPNAHPFIGVQLGYTYYWSSSTVADEIDYARIYFFSEGYGGSAYKTDGDQSYVWPVRGGQ